MFAVLVALVLLIACVGAIYWLLKSMGQDGVEVAAPGSCKRGSCGVRSGDATKASCQTDSEPFSANAETTVTAAADQPPPSEEKPNRL